MPLFRRRRVDTSASCQLSRSRSRCPAIFDALASLCPELESLARKGKLHSKKGLLLWSEARRLWDEAFVVAWPTALQNLDLTRCWELGLRLLTNFHLLGVDRTPYDPYGHRSQQLQYEITTSWATNLNSLSSQLDEYQHLLAEKRARLSTLHAYTTSVGIRPSSKSSDEFAREEARLRVEVANEGERWRAAVDALNKEIRRFEEIARS